MSTWPANGFVEASSGATLAMLPMHEPLIAQLLGAQIADALTSGCKVAALGPGDTYPSNVVYYANNLNIPAQVLTLLAGQGYSVDGTGCVLQNGAPAANAPLVAYEPGDTNASAPTYTTTTPLTCAGIASLGQTYPTNSSGPQILVPVVPGSKAGNCSVTVTAAPAPSNASGLGSGVVPVQLVGPCVNNQVLAVGSSCFAVGFNWQPATVICDPPSSYGSGWTGSGYMLAASSSPSTGVFTRSPATIPIWSATSNMFTRVGPGTITIQAREGWQQISGMGATVCRSSFSFRLIGSITLN